MATWRYRLMVASKVNGGVPLSSHLSLVEAVEDFVNEYGPRPSGVRCVLSEGPTQRTVHCWVRADRGPNRYDMEHVVYNSQNPNAFQNAMSQLLSQGAIPIGIDAGQTQSLHYLRPIN